MGQLDELRMEWRALVSNIRSDIADWPKIETSGFSCALFKYIGDLRFEIERLNKALKEIQDKHYFV